MIFGQCSVEWCDSPARIKGLMLCNAHYQQQHKGKPFTTPRVRGSADIGVDGWRRCTHCLSVKKIDEFYARSDKYYSAKCKRCATLQSLVGNTRRKYGESSEQHVEASERFSAARNSG